MHYNNKYVDKSYFFIFREITISELLRATLMRREARPDESNRREVFHEVIEVKVIDKMREVESGATLIITKHISINNIC